MGATIEKQQLLIDETKASLSSTKMCTRAPSQATKRWIMLPKFVGSSAEAPDDLAGGYTLQTLRSLPDRRRLCR
jgi:hypothetical protein